MKAKRIKKFEKKERKGFTVLELIIVILIFSVLAGIAIPAFRSITSESLEGKANKFAQDIRMFRERAIARNLECKIWRLDLNTYRVQFEGEPVRTYNFDGRFGYAPNVTAGVPEGGGPGYFVFPPSDTLIFKPRGSAQSAGGIYITNGTETYGIGIALSGRVKLWKWGGSSWY